MMTMTMAMARVPVISSHTSSDVFCRQLVMIKQLVRSERMSFYVDPGIARIP